VVVPASVIITARTLRRLPILTLVDKALIATARQLTIGHVVCPFGGGGGGGRVRHTVAFCRACGAGGRAAGQCEARVLFGVLPLRGHVGLVVAEGWRDVFGLGTPEEAVEERVLFGVACFLEHFEHGLWCVLALALVLVLVWLWLGFGLCAWRTWQTWRWYLGWVIAKFAKYDN